MLGSSMNLPFFLPVFGRFNFFFSMVHTEETIFEWKKKFKENHPTTHIQLVRREISSFFLSSTFLECSFLFFYLWIFFFGIFFSFLTLKSRSFIKRIGSNAFYFKTFFFSSHSKYFVWFGHQS